MRKKKWSRPDLLGKPMNIFFQLYNIQRILISRKIYEVGVDLSDVERDLHLMENYHRILEEQYLSIEGLKIKDVLYQ